MVASTSLTKASCPYTWAVMLWTNLQASETLFIYLNQEPLQRKPASTLCHSVVNVNDTASRSYSKSMPKPTSLGKFSRDLRCLRNEVTAAIAECLTALLEVTLAVHRLLGSQSMSRIIRGCLFNEQKVFGRRALTDDDGNVSLCSELPFVC